MVLFHPDHILTLVSQVSQPHGAVLSLTPLGSPRTHPACDAVMVKVGVVVPTTGTQMVLPGGKVPPPQQHEAFRMPLMPR